jgi:hypothetical protein
VKFMIELPEITLCAMDGVNWRMAARSLEISMRGARFADTICFSLERAAQPCSFRTIQIEELKDISAYSPFLMKQMHAHIRTPFALVTQWDGYVIHPEAWRPEFMDYDYIGARWHWHPKHRVGNGGFSLRSKKLLDALQHPEFRLIEGINEDDLTCRIYRDELEKNHGIRFAPDNVADQFSYECSQVRSPTFGFHGMMNLRREISLEDLHQMNIVAPECIRKSPYWQQILQELNKINPCQSAP